jgi:hypothetical protein
MNKYRSKKITVNGITYDSKKEMRRHLVLLDMERKGEISDLQRQVKFVLIPAQREPDTTGSRGGVKKGKLIERECAYVADFVYSVVQKDTSQSASLTAPFKGSLVVEDTKGVRTKDYVIKRKLMLWVHGIQIKEI